MNIVGSICKDTQKYANNQKENHIFFFPTSIQKRQVTLHERPVFYFLKQSSYL